MEGRTAIIGANGQLGRDLCRAFAHAEIVSLTHRDIEVTDRDIVRKMLTKIAPDIVINTAAFHAVDLCETDPWRAFEVNAIGAHVVASVAREIGALTVYISTDYVFAGDAVNPYREDAVAHPINVYGASKLAGERLVLDVDPFNLVIRSSGLFGKAGASGKGGNFVELMRRLGRERGEVTVVTDQVLGPTYTADLAATVARLIEQDAHGTVHVTNSGACSWHEFAAAIFELSALDIIVHPTTTEKFGAIARRPAYSVLDNCVLTRFGIPQLRPWRQALQAYLSEQT